MIFFEIILISIGLAMDAFAVAICKGLNMRKIDYRQAIIIALYFGFFQGIMPLIGWLLGVQFQQYITAFDHWIAFILLSFLGGKMIYEAIKSKSEECCKEVPFKHRDIFVLAIATSIDALAVGVSFAFLKVDIISSVITIGVITLILSFIGVIIGNKFGVKFKSKAEIFGGVVLILMGLKILLEHLGYISF